jgi:hypothetical protein
MSSFRFKPANPEEYLYTLEATLSIAQWRKVLEALDCSEVNSSVKWDLRAEISQLIQKAETHFQLQAEEYAHERQGS